jgi:hypothetical protein
VGIENGARDLGGKFGGKEKKEKEAEEVEERVGSRMRHRQ